MKQKIIGATLCAIACVPLAAEDTMTLPVSETQDRVIVALWEGDITVTPTTDEAIGMTLDCEPPAEMNGVGEDGFRSLRASSTLPDITTSDTVIAIRTVESGPQCSVALTVPARLDLNTRVNAAGSIRIDAGDGRLLAWSSEGDVTVNNQRRSLSVTAMNGDATVTLADGGIDADSAITAANGTLTVTLAPDNTPAMRAQARWGDVKTNLDVAFSEVMEDGNSWFATPARDDQPVLTLRNLNKDIVIRKAD